VEEKWAFEPFVFAKPNRVLKSIKKWSLTENFGTRAPTDRFAIPRMLLSFALLSLLLKHEIINETISDLLSDLQVCKLFTALSI